MTPRSGVATVDSLTAHSDWVESLLELFWATDKVVSGEGEDVPEAIMRAYEKAEKARQQL